MAKTTRRPNIPQEALDRARRQMEREGTLPALAETPATVADAAPVPVVRHHSTTANLRAEYAYVLTDMRNMGMLAATFLAVLIVLSLII